MVDIDPCDICGIKAETIPSHGDYLHQKCPACGEYKISGTAIAVLKRKYKEKKRLIRGWIRDQLREGAIPYITSDTLDVIMARPLPSVKERAERILFEVLNNNNKLGASFDCIDPSLVAATYSLDEEELFFLEKYLFSKNLIGGDEMNKYKILPEGYIYVDDILNKGVSASTNGFIAMWFDPSMDGIHEDGFQAAILDAGYNPVRVDHIDHINRIDDEIIASINSARFVVADFTGHRGGVYFEAGYALGKNIPIFWTCRSDDMDKLHFDIRQYNCIDWKTTEELRHRLSKRIEAVVSLGPHK